MTNKLRLVEQVDEATAPQTLEPKKSVLEFSDLSSPGVRARRAEWATNREASVKNLGVISMQLAIPIPEASPSNPLPAA